MDAARAGDIDANTARVLIDGEKWLASKRAPRTHGDKVEIEHSGSIGQPPIINVNVVAVEAKPVAIDAESEPQSLPAEFA